MILKKLVSYRPAPSHDRLDRFTVAYFDAAVYDSPALHLDWRVDFHQSAYDRSVQDCAEFQGRAGSLIKRGFRRYRSGWEPSIRAGWDFWGARNGVPFPGDYWLLDFADWLTDIAVAFGSAGLYVSPVDHLVYQSGAEDA